MGAYSAMTRGPARSARLVSHCDGHWGAAVSSASAAWVRERELEAGAEQVGLLPLLNERGVTVAGGLGWLGGWGGGWGSGGGPPPPPPPPRPRGSRGGKAGLSKRQETNRKTGALCAAVVRGAIAAFATPPGAATVELELLLHAGSRHH